MADDRGPKRPGRNDRPHRNGKPADSSRGGRPGAGGQRRDGAPSRKPRDGERREYKPRDGERREYKPRDGERRVYKSREDDRGEKREYKPRDRDNHRDRGRSDRGRPDRGREEWGRSDRGRDDRGRGERLGRGGTRGDGRSDRGGAGREYTEAERLEHELRPVRAHHTDPEIPENVTPKSLNPQARDELKTLDKDLADRVACHLAMVSMLLDTDPELAHQHAISASRRAGRIPVVRETLAITSYVRGDYAMALRELRTYRRLCGRDDQLAMMIDCERGLGRPEKALELGRSVDRSSLPVDVQVQVAIAMSGARLDLGQTQQALFELEIPQLDPTKAFSYSPELFACYANVLEDLGRTDDAKLWQQRAEQAEAAIEDQFAGDDTVVVVEQFLPTERADEAEAEAAANEAPKPEVAE